MILNIKFMGELAQTFYNTSANQSFYGSDEAAGFDLRACIDQPITLLAGEQKMIPTGIAIEVSNELHANALVAGMVVPRSGRGSKEGLVLGNTVGIIDQDYRGEIILCVWARPIGGVISTMTNRLASDPVKIQPGERIAQLLLMPVIRPTKIKTVDKFYCETQRGIGGFGSTGNQ